MESRREESESSVEAFGFDQADDSWLGRLRTAEEPFSFGGTSEFQVLEEISRGGQGVVYRAWQPKERRQVAVKRLIGGVFAGADAKRRLDREVEASQNLEHENIVTVYGLSEIGGEPVLVMEWIDGIRVTDWVEKNLPTRRREDVMRLVLRICDAVQHAHQRAVLHRDLKPSNILVDQSGSPRLLDFGLAKRLWLEDGGTLTISSQFVGTPAYASPEQIRGAGGVDVRSDVYSAGMILFELLTGRLPYALPPHPGEWVRMLDSVEVPRVSSIRRGLGRELDTILLRALEQDVSERYQSIDAFAEDMRLVLSGEPIRAHPPSSFYYLRKFVKRHPWPVVFFATVLLFVVTFGVWASIQASLLKEQRDEAIRARESAEVDKAKTAAARKEATADKARADAVLQFFLSDLFASASLYTSAGSSAVLDAVRDTENRLEDSFPADPVTRGAIYYAMGWVYLELDYPDQAETNLRKAFNLYSEQFRYDDPRALAACRIWAQALIAKGDYDGAQTLLNQTLAGIRGKAGYETDYAAVVDTFGRLQEANERYAAAEIFYRRVLQILADREEPANLISTTRTNLARALFHRGQLKEAEDVLRSAARFDWAKFGDKSVFEGQKQFLLARILLARGDCEEAESLIRQSIEID